MECPNQRRGAAAAFVVLLGWTVCATSGCFTTWEVGNWIRESKEYSGEFIKAGYDLPWEHYSGSYTGIVDRNDGAYREYRFRNILKGGQSRNLVILVREEGAPGGEHVIVSESSIAAHEVKPAELYLLWSFEVVYSAINDSDREAEKTLEKQFPGCLRIDKYSPHQLVASFQPENYGPAVYYMPLETQGDTVQWEVAIADVDLDWNARGRTSFYMLHLNYIWAVPVDVVTFPFLCVAMLVAGVS